MGKHGNKDHNKILTKMLGLERWNRLSRIDKIINATLAGIIVIAVVEGIIAFVPHHLEDNTKQEAVSSTIVHSKKTKDKSTDRNEKSAKKSDIVISKNADSNRRPNEGKTLYFDTIDTAIAAIDEHKASCPYKLQYCYNGVVYAGTYKCNCGLKIVWNDLAVKKGFEEGHSNDPRVKKYIGETDDNNSENDDSAGSSSESATDDSEKTSVNINVKDNSESQDEDDY